MPTDNTPDTARLTPDEMPYPVIREVVLSPLRRRFLRASSRRMDEIPPQPVGTVLVFQVGSQYLLAPEGPSKLATSVLMNANAIAVVSIRREAVPLSVRVYSWDSHGYVQISATFHCRVLDPVATLGEGCVRVQPPLRSYLLADAKLRMLATNQDMSAEPIKLQRLLTARLLAYHETTPPLITGMELQLGEIDVQVRKSFDLSGDEAR